jgi:hypothetical protein
MSQPRLRRRRRARRRATAMAGDAMDLFLDAMTNTLGVVMFILLVVVLFGRPVVPVRLPDPRPWQALEALRAQRDDLAARVAALPPAGDPALVARWRAAMDAVRALQPEVDRLRNDVVRRTAGLAGARSALERAEAERADLAARVAAVEERARESGSGLVRVGRFRPDARPAVLLAVSEGRLSRVQPTSATAEIAAPRVGEPVRDVAGARAALRALLADAPAGSHRVELAVWADSFAAAKVVEQVLLEMGYDTNPLPVERGKPLGAGAGGVQ